MNKQPITPFQKKRIIFNHQRGAFEKLLNLAKATFYTQRSTLPIRPRTNSLIASPSGSGKTSLAKAVADECRVPFLQITAGNWIPLGASNRGSSITWPMICNFLKKNYKAEGTIIFLDEIDKLIGEGWTNFIRVEAFCLLDLRIPEGLTNGDGVPIDEVSIARAQEVLSERTLILAAGAFQHIWEKRARPVVGFFDTTGIVEQKLDLNDLSATIPRELTNRFRSDIIVMPQLLEADYRGMLDASAAEMPPYLKETFLRLGNERVYAAVRCGLGCRFLEEILADTLMTERAAILAFSKESDNPDHITKQVSAPESKADVMHSEAV